MSKQSSNGTANRDRLVFEHCDTLNSTLEQFVVQR